MTEDNIPDMDGEMEDAITRALAEINPPAQAQKPGDHLPSTDNGVEVAVKRAEIDELLRTKEALKQAHKADAERIEFEYGSARSKIQQNMDILHKSLADCEARLKANLANMDRAKKTNDDFFAREMSALTQRIDALRAYLDALTGIKPKK